MGFRLNPYIKDFPILLKKDDRGRRIAYLDNGATTQKPVSVIKAIENYYHLKNANPHRGAYDLSTEATNALEEVREKVRKFIGAEKIEEIIFTKNATEALNIIARSYGEHLLNKEDKIVVAISEHHSNLVPWQYIAKIKETTLTYMYTDKEGIISLEEIEDKITEGTKVVAVAHVSNITGAINPIEHIIKRAHEVGAIVVVDGTQSVPHMPVNVSKLDADFYVFSGHKMLGPLGIGVLYGKEKLLNAMPPFLFGGDMIEYVEEQFSSFAPLPQKFEAGTHNVGGAIGLGAAIDYLESIDMENIQLAEHELMVYMMESLKAVPHLNIVGPQNPDKRIGVFSFTIDDIHPHDVATILNSDNIAIRTGHHCAQPFHKYLGVPSTCRASIYLYNTKEDIDRLRDGLNGVRRWLGYGA